MRRAAWLFLISSCLIGIASPAHASSDIVIGLWPQNYSQFLAIRSASGIPFPYFRARLQDGQFDANLIGAEAHAAADAGYSIGLNIEPKTGSGHDRVGILYTDISAQILAGSGAYYDKLVSFANEILALPTYGVVPNYLQFHSEASTQAPPGVPASQPYSGTGPEYQQCYALVHQLFDALGVTDKIYWQIVLTQATYSGNQGGPQSWYPSDPGSYDLVGVDAYYRSPTWLSPSAAFGPALAFARSQGKRLWIDETGADEGGPKPASATAKADWFRSLAAYLGSNVASISGVVFSHAPDGGNWFLDSKFPFSNQDLRSLPNYTGTSWNGWTTAVTALLAAVPIRTLSVALAGSGSGSVSSAPSGIACPGDCAETIAQGDALGLTAVAEPGSVFTGWGGACSGTGPCDLVIDADTSVTATFEELHTLTLAISGGGTGSITTDLGSLDCPTSCVASDLVHGVHVALTVAPDPGSALAGWAGGGCSGTAPTCDVTMDSDTTVTVTLSAAIDMTVTLAGNGTGTVLSVPNDEIDCPPTCAHPFAENGTVTLHAVAGVNSIFTGWGGDAADGCHDTGDCTLTMDAARSVTATFQPAWLLHVVRVGAVGDTVASDVGGIDCGATCDRMIQDGTIVTLSSTDSPGSTFESWSGDCTGAAECVLTMDQAHAVTAHYSSITWPLTVTETDGTGAGAVTSLTPNLGIDCGVVCRFDFQQGSSVTLHAVPDIGSSFVGWDIAGCPGSGDCTVSIDTAKTVNARFDLVRHALSITKAGTGTGQITSNTGGIDCPGTCSANVDHGTTVILSATPSGGATFAGWSGGPCAGTGTCIVTMDTATAVTGSFDPPVVVRTLRDNDPAVAYGGWMGVADPAANGGAYRMSNVKDDTATWRSPTTTSISWVSHTGPDQGKASVTIDGKSRGTVDLYSASPATVTRVFSGLAKRAHTVSIKTLGQKNSASTGFGVGLDAFVVGGTTVQESDPKIQYDGWTGTAQASATDSTYRSSENASATVRVTFNGTSIDWITTKGKAYGKSSITIDGLNMGTVDLYRAATTWRSLVSYGGLSPGLHSLVIRVLGQKNPAATGKTVVVDGFVVHG